MLRAARGTVAKRAVVGVRDRQGFVQDNIVEGAAACADDSISCRGTEYVGRRNGRPLDPDDQVNALVQGMEGKRLPCADLLNLPGTEIPATRGKVLSGTITVSGTLEVDPWARRSLFS